jgi:hypothetical protein
LALQLTAQPVFREIKRPPTKAAALLLRQPARLVKFAVNPLLNSVGRHAHEPRAHLWASDSSLGYQRLN